MGIINPSLPIVGLSAGTEDAKTRAALEAILGVLNGDIDTTNLKAGTALANLAANSVTDAKLQTKTVRGVVSSAGAVSAGSGFTAQRNGPGNFTVTFTTPFAAAPVAFMSVNTTPAARISGVVLARTTTAVQFGFLQEDGDSIDVSFSFLAVSV